MKSTLIAVCVAVSAVTAFAADQATHQESRNSYTNNDAVVAVGDCSFPMQYTDLLNNQRIKAQFSVTSCKEVKHYQVNVAGSGWTAKESEVAGTETFTYEMKNETKESDQVYNANDAFQTMSVSSQCNSMRDGFVQAQRAMNGRSKCNQ